MLAPVGSSALLEREPIARALVPDLQNRLRSHGLAVAEHDPFRGVDPTKITADQLRAILDSVRRTRPLFVGLLGRATSRPVPSDVLLDAALLRHYPWLEQMAHAGHGVAEIVLMEGVLANPLMAGRALLVAQAEEPLTTRALQLRARAVSAGIRIHEVSSHEQAIDTLRKGLMSLVERLYLEARPSSPFEQARRAQAAFAASRRYAYVEVGDYSAQLEAHVAGDGPPLVVTGESGSGKSALLANWASTYRAAHPDAFLIEHYTGADAGANHIGTIRRIIEEIRIRYGIDDDAAFSSRSEVNPKPVTEQEIVEALPLWLAMLEKERLVLIIDGLNQLSDRDDELSWLPTHIPPSVRLIVSTTDGPVRAELARRGWQQLRMRPLATDERRRVVTEFLGTRSAMLNPEQLRRVSDASSSSNPLFLRMRLEELRAPGPIGDLTTRIEGYLEATDLGDLFQRVIERLEHTHGRRLVMSVLTLLHASRRGLTELELEGMVDESCGPLLPVLADLDFHLINREGIYTFFHERMRQAVATRYDLENLNGRRSDPHLKIAAYFSSQPMSQRRIDEEAWQYRHVGSPKRLRKLIVSVPAFLELSEPSREYELLGYWRWIGTTEQMAAAYRRVVDSEPPDDTEHWRLTLRMGVFMYHAGEYEAARAFLAQSADEAKVVGASELVEVQRQRIPLLLECGLYQESIEICRQILDEYGSSDSDPLVIRALISLADALHYVGEIDEAETICRRAIAASERVHGSEHRVTTEAVHNLATLLADKDEKLIAESLLRRVVAVDEKTFGPEHPELATSLASLSDILEESSESEEAFELARRALGIRLRTLGPKHPHTGYSLNQVGLLLNRSGDADAARDHLERALRILERHLGPHHSATASVLANLGTVVEDVATSVDLMTRALEAMVESVGKSHPTTLLVMCQLGMKLLASDKERAIALLEESTNGLAASLGESHTKTAWAKAHLASALFERGDFVRAEELALAALHCCGDVTGESTTVAVALTTLAEIKLTHGEPTDAARLASQALDLLGDSEEPVNGFRERARAIASPTVHVVREN